jgi:hypothetical protein
MNYKVFIHILGGGGGREGSPAHGGRDQRDQLLHGRLQPRPYQVVCRWSSVLVLPFLWKCRRNKKSPTSFAIVCRWGGGGLKKTTNMKFSMDGKRKVELCK